MHLLYLDDAGSAKNQNEDYLVLGGVSIFESQVHWITQKLDRLAESICPDKPDSVEFHASEIFSRRTAPWRGMSREEAQGIIKAVLEVLRQSYDSARAFACAVQGRATGSGRTMHRMEGSAHEPRGQDGWVGSGRTMHTDPNYPELQGSE